MPENRQGLENRGDSWGNLSIAYKHRYKNLNKKLAKHIQPWKEYQIILPEEGKVLGIQFYGNSR